MRLQRSTWCALTRSVSNIVRPTCRAAGAPRRRPAAARSSRVHPLREQPAGWGRRTVRYAAPYAASGGGHGAVWNSGGVQAPGSEWQICVGSGVGLIPLATWLGLGESGGRGAGAARHKRAAGVERRAGAAAGSRKAGADTQAAWAEQR